MSLLIVVPVLFLLSMISGMLGIGVAFAAVPLLSLFMDDLVNEVHPLSLILNGVTALFAVFGFAHAGLVRWKKAAILSISTTIGAPVGALLARSVPEIYLWIIYFLAVLYLLYEMFVAEVTENGQERFTLALFITLPISVITGFIGVGPGFMLVPVLAKCGIKFKEAAALNAFAVVPSSFAAAAMHLRHSHLDAVMVSIFVACGAMGALLGSVIASHKMPTALLRRVLGLTILAVTAYKLFQILHEGAIK